MNKLVELKLSKEKGAEPTAYPDRLFVLTNQITHVMSNSGVITVHLTDGKMYKIGESIDSVVQKIQ